VATVSTNWWKGVVGGDESLGLPGGDNAPLHGVVGDGYWLGFRSKGNLKLVDGEENSSRGVGDDVVGDEWSLSAPNLRLV
jgi:hypothetical protein